MFTIRTLIDHTHRYLPSVMSRASGGLPCRAVPPSVGHASCAGRAAVTQAVVERTLTERATAERTAAKRLAAQRRGSRTSRPVGSAIMLKTLEAAQRLRVHTATARAAREQQRQREANQAFVEAGRSGLDLEAPPATGPVLAAALGYELPAAQRRAMGQAYWAAVAGGAQRLLRG